MSSRDEALDDQVHQHEDRHYAHQEYQEQLEDGLHHLGGVPEQLDEFGQEEEEEGDVELNIPDDQLQQHHLDLQFHHLQHLEQPLQIDEHGNPLQQQHDHDQQEGGGGSNQAHLLLLDDLARSSSTASSIYDHTLCKYVLGADDGDGCYGKLFESRQEALSFVTTNIKSLEGVDARTIDFKVSRCAVPEHVWRAVMDSELAKGTGYVEIAVELDTERVAKRGGSKRKKAKLSHPPTTTNLTTSLSNSHLDHLSPPPHSTSSSSDSSTFDLQPNHFLPRPAHYPPLGTNTNIHHLPSLPNFFPQHPSQPQPQPSYSEIDDLEPEGGYGNDDEFPEPLNNEDDEDLDLSLLPEDDNDGNGDGDETNSLDGTNDDAEPKMFLPAGLLNFSEPIGLAEEQQLNAWNLPSSVYQQMVTAAGGGDGGFGGVGNAEASGSGSGGFGGEMGEGGGGKKKRKPSRYNVFYGTEYLRLKSEHPDMENTQIIREVARLWSEEPSNPRNAKGRKPREERPPTLYTEYYHIEYARLKREDPSQSNEARNRVVAVNWAASPVNPKTRKRKRKTLLIEPRTEGYLHSPSGGATEAAVMAARMQSQEVEGFARRLAELADAEGEGGGGSVEGDEGAGGGDEEQQYSHPDDDDEGGEQHLNVDDQRQHQQHQLRGEEADPSNIQYDLDPSLINELSSTHPHHPDQLLQLDPQLVELGDLDPQLVGMGLDQHQPQPQQQHEDSELGMDMEGLRQLHRMQQEQQALEEEEGEQQQEQEEEEGDPWGDYDEADLGLGEGS